LDMKGKYVLPGLIDCHTHLSTLAAARLALESGVTTVRSSGVSTYADVGLRELVRKGALAGPDVVATGYHIRPRLAEEAFLSDPTLALMKQRGTFYVPTYATVIDLAEPGGDYDLPALRNRGRHMLPRLRSTIRRAHRLGTRIATGADTSYGPNSLTRISQEVAAFVEIGF